ncbi:MAG TPA: ABC transporter ATP-binding protein [Candidatus Nanopelagicales bacterium]|nr:ABC transporter ATP-binding protein [Candidatus Nanopelagicales bacterium]
MTTTAPTPGLAAGGPRGAAVEVASLTKRFGDVLAVDDLSFTVEPGRVTGFLGPNGAGKTTTLRCLLGLVAPTSGTATIGGRAYDDIAHPTRVVGSALEATGFHPGRSARNHLRVLARAGGIDERRADSTLELVGLSEAAKRSVGGFSLGMRQRLQLAAALLGDPGVLVLDEPANGLDPEGIAWLRSFLRYLASEGRTVLVSSHVLSEVEQTVDDVVIIANGRLVRACALEELTADHSHVVVRTPDPQRLADAIAAHAPHARVTTDEGALHVVDADAATIGHIAFGAHVELHELRPAASDLEQVFLSLTGGAAS